jgi:RHS repeat-associated protein
VERADPHKKWTKPRGPVRAGSPDPFQFASGYYDSEFDLTKFGTRYHDSATTRWTQQDPRRGQISSPISLNPYAYGGCDPINNVDPTGLFSLKDFGVGLYEAVDTAVLAGTTGAIAFGCAAGGVFSGGTALAVAGVPCALGIAGAATATGLSAYASYVELKRAFEE